jgi:hypothetical protein
LQVQREEEQVPRESGIGVLADREGDDEPESQYPAGGRQEPVADDPSVDPAEILPVEPDERPGSEGGA